MVPCALLNLTWLHSPFLQSSGQIPLHPSQSCSPLAQPDSEMQFHRQDSSHGKGMEPWPSSPLCNTNKRIFVIVVAEDWFRVQIFPAFQNSSHQLFCPVPAESSTLWKELMGGAVRLAGQRTSVRKIFTYHALPDAHRWCASNALNASVETKPVLSTRAVSFQLPVVVRRLRMIIWLSTSRSCEQGWAGLDGR